MASCTCHTCGKRYASLGIARHRAMHRDKGEDCEITYKNGERWKHNFAKSKKPTTVWDRHVGNPQRHY